MLRQAPYVDGVSPRSITACHVATAAFSSFEPVAHLTESHQGRGGDRRVIEADDTQVVVAGCRVVALSEQLAGTDEEGDRLVPRQTTGRLRNGPGTQRAGVAHGADCTGAAAGGRRRVGGPGEGPRGASSAVP